MSDSLSTPVKTRAQIERCADIKTLAAIVLGIALLFLTVEVMLHVMHGISLVEGIVALSLITFAIIAKLDADNTRMMFVIAGGAAVSAVLAYPVFTSLHKSGANNGILFFDNAGAGIVGFAAAATFVMVFFLLRPLFVEDCKKE